MESDSIFLAQTHVKLFEIRAEINSEILPRLSYLQCPDDELLQTLDLAAQSIDSYFKKYRLEAVPVKGGE